MGLRVGVAERVRVEVGVTLAPDARGVPVLVAVLLVEGAPVPEGEGVPLPVPVPLGVGLSLPVGLAEGGGWEGTIVPAPVGVPVGVPVGAAVPVPDGVLLAVLLLLASTATLLVVEVGDRKSVV